MTANLFLRFGVLYALIGVSMGVYMGASHDFSFAPVHGHINLIGWVSMFLAGLFYRAHPQSDNRLSLVHLALSVTGLCLLAPGIYGAITAQPWAGPVVGSGSVLTLLSMALFAFVVFRSDDQSAQA